MKKKHGIILSALVLVIVVPACVGLFNSRQNPPAVPAPAAPISKKTLQSSPSTDSLQYLHEAFPAEASRIITNAPGSPALAEKKRE